MHSPPLVVGELSSLGFPPTDICSAVQEFHRVLRNPFPISEFTNKILNFYSLDSLKKPVFWSDLLMFNLHRNTQHYLCLLEPLLSRLHPVHTEPISPFSIRMFHFVFGPLKSKH